MKHIFTCSFVVAALIASTPLMAQDHSNHERGAVQEKGIGIHGHHSEHNHITSPVSVMGAHLHDKGDWMLSYTYRCRVHNADLSRLKWPPIKT